MKELDDWPHPERCPSSSCRGAFLFLRYYGIICSVRLEQLTGGSMTKVIELSEKAHIERSEGLGLS